MRLTQKQEWMISQYLRDVNKALGSTPATVREQTLTRLNARIYHRLNEIATAGLITDDDVLAALRDSGSAEKRQAQKTVQRPERTPIASKPSAQTSASSYFDDDDDDEVDDRVDPEDDFGGLTLSSDDRVLLGVCGGVAGYFGLDTRWIRAMFLALGVTGPIALIAYIGLYAEMYLHSNPEKTPRVESTRIFSWVSATLGGILGLNIIVSLFLWGVSLTYERVAKLGPLSGLGYWDWLRINSSFFTICALAIFIPLAVLGSLPVPDNWNYTLKRVIQAGAVIYAFLLSFGAASFLVGAILHAIKGVAA